MRLLYKNYLSTAEDYYKKAEFSEAFLKASGTEDELYQEGTPPYLISICYFILTAYRDGSRKAYEMEEGSVAWNRSFAEEADEIVEYIKNKFIELNSISEILKDKHYSETIGYIHRSIAKILLERSTNFSGDFTHACAAIYMIFARANAQHQARTERAAQLVREGKIDELVSEKLTTEDLNCFNASYHRIELLLQELATTPIAFFNQFIINFRVIFNHEPEVEHAELRFYRYYLLAQKADAAASIQSLIEALESYTRRFQWTGAGIPVPTYRTHRQQALHLLDQLKRYSGEGKNLASALKALAGFETVANGELQHLLVGIYWAFSSERGEEQARLIGHCKVKIGNAPLMSVKAFYQKFIVESHTNEEYSRYQAALPYLNLLRKGEREKIPVAIRLIADVIATLYLSKFSNPALLELVRITHAWLAPPSFLARASAALSPTKAPAKASPDVFLKFMLAELSSIITTSFSRESATEAQQELIYLVCAIYDFLSKLHLGELAEIFAKLQLPKEKPATDSAAAEAETASLDIADATREFITVKEQVDYWKDDASSLALDDDARSIAEAGSDSSGELVVEGDDEPVFELRRKASDGSGKTTLSFLSRRTGTERRGLPSFFTMPAARPRPNEAFGRRHRPAALSAAAGAGSSGVLTLTPR